MLLVVLGGFLWLIQWIMNRQAKQSEGHTIPDTTEVDGGVTDSLRVYYFFSHSCGPCRSMKPMVNKLAEDNPNLIQVDIAQHAKVARGFGIAGVPSFVVVEGNIIKQVELGRVSQKWLSQWFSE